LNYIIRTSGNFEHFETPNGSLAENNLENSGYLNLNNSNDYVTDINSEPLEPRSEPISQNDNHPS